MASSSSNSPHSPGPSTNGPGNSEAIERVQLGHGGGGSLSQQLIAELLVPAFGPSDGVLHDAATFKAGPGPLAFSTDAYVVRPLIFPGGDIGRLAVIGTVNDLAMVGARPLALSLALILEEGLAMATLRQVVASIRTAAAACGVPVLTGDTKVVERGKGDGLYITTSGVGSLGPGPAIGPPAVRPGDAIVVSGDLGRHGAAILAARHELGFQTELCSDLASLLPAVQALLGEGLEVHALRDLTRGGLASALFEIARDTGLLLQIEEEAVPIAPAVASACELLGLDPLAMANEGRLVLFLPAAEAAQALAVLQSFQPEAAIIGAVADAGVPDGSEPSAAGSLFAPIITRGAVLLRNAYGVQRRLTLGRGEQLPRIC